MNPRDWIGPRSLVKFCKPEHNVLNGCPTLRLGTLDYFPKLSDTDRRSDSEEGIENLDIEFFARGSSDQQSLNEFEHAWGTTAQGNAYKDCETSVTFPNVWVWCCSMVHPPGERREDFGKLWSDDYTSEFSIGDPMVFANYLNVLASLFLQVRHLSNSSIDQLKLLPFSQASALKCVTLHGPVVYVDEKKTVLNDGPIREYLTGYPRELRPLFSKPKQYEEEQEYRFVVAVVHPHIGVLGVGEHPVNIPITPVHRNQ